MSDVCVNNAIVYTIPAHSSKKVLTPSILYSILFYFNIAKLLLYSVKDRIVMSKLQVIFMLVFSTKLQTRKSVSIINKWKFIGKSRWSNFLYTYDYVANIAVKINDITNIITKSITATPLLKNYPLNDWLSK